MFSAHRIVPPPSPLSTDQSLETSLSIARAMLHPSLGVLLQYLPGIRFLRVYAPFLLGCLWFLSLHTHSLSWSHSTAPCLPNFWLPQPRTFFCQGLVPRARAQGPTSKVEEDKKNTADGPCSRISWRMLGPTPASSRMLSSSSGQRGASCANNGGGFRKNRHGLAFQCSLEEAAGVKTLCQTGSGFLGLFVRPRLNQQPSPERQQSGSNQGQEDDEPTKPNEPGKPPRRAKAKAASAAKKADK